MLFDPPQVLKHDDRSGERYLRRVLAASLLLPLVMLIGGGVLSYRAHFEDARERLMRFADLMHEHAVKLFETQELIADRINATLAGLTDEEVRGREQEINTFLKGLSQNYSHVQGVWVIDAAGHPLAAANTFPVRRDLDLSDRTYFIVHRDGLVPPETHFVSEVLTGRAFANRRFFQIAVRRHSPSATPDGFAGVIAISIEPSYFERFYEQGAAGRFSVVTLLREDGAVLARFPPLPPGASKQPLPAKFAAAIAAKPEAGLYRDVSPIDDTMRTVAYRHLPGYPIYVTVGIDDNVVVSEWLARMGIHLIYGVPSVAALFGLTLIALRRTRSETDALRRLNEESHRRELIEAQLRQSQKMEAIGRLTGGIAHDFNNLLQISIGSLDILSRRMAEGDARSRELVQAALEGLTRAANLTQRLLAYARRQPLEPKAIDVNRLVQNVSEFLRATLGETVHIETVLAGGLWRAYADANQLESAIVNLAVNARDAMPDGGRLTIETANAHLDEDYAAQHSDVAAGQYVVISVSDTGAGMTPEVTAKAFEPFFTTKPAGQGTGLGLSQVYGFIKQSGGHVKIYSEPGNGTAVKLYLPRRYGACREEEQAERVTPAAGDTGAVILVVEDEERVRQFVSRALAEIGYGVLEAPGGKRALDLIDAHPEIALLVTDVVMPEMTGRVLADLALARRPGLRVLFMTGYTKNAIVHNGVLDPKTRLISKPFTVSQLAAKVKETLSEPPDEPAAPQSVAPPPPPPAPAHEGPLRVLVVDDEPLVALGLVDLLEEQGHTVVEAVSAAEAIERLSVETFDVVITDHTMPGMTGKELAEVIHVKWPRTGVVLSTGHLDVPGVDFTKTPRLEKPFRAAQVREVLQTSRQA